MKAFMATSYGGPEVMTLGDLPDPVALGGEVVVSVKAASVNPVDWKLRNGMMRVVASRRFPKIYGLDLAGVVRSIGPNVTGLCVGDSVYGCKSILFGQPGTHAEQVAIAARRLRRIPAGLSFEQAAALPVAALTALNGLRKCGDLSSRTVVVNGATGGVGHFAVQIARSRGAKVIAVCSRRNVERAKTLGAEHVIDYKSQDFTRQGQCYDIVFDAWGQLGPAAVRRTLSARGSYVTTLGSPALGVRALWQRIIGGRRIVFAALRARPEDYAALEADLVAGRVVPIVDKAYPLDQAADAFAALEAGGVVGKVVIRLA